MGFPPPLDGPPPEVRAELDAGFEPSPTGAILCGFGLPSFGFSFSIPSFSLPFPVLPNLNVALAMKCDLSDPIDAEFGFGGGRVPTGDVDPDDALS